MIDRLPTDGGKAQVESSGLDRWSGRRREKGWEKRIRPSEGHGDLCNQAPGISGGSGIRRAPGNANPKGQKNKKNGFDAVNTGVGGAGGVLHLFRLVGEVRAAAARGQQVAPSRLHSGRYCSFKARLFFLF